MRNITRRQFLSRFFLALASSIALGPISYANNRIKGRAVDWEGGAALKECRIVSHEWSKNEKINPMEYLINTMERYQLEPWRITDASRLDFQHQNLFMVNGLQLSKTEAAFLAMLGYEEMRLLS